MNSIADIRESLCDRVLDLVWRQWSAIGVAGTNEVSRTIVDPEALLVVSMTLGRRDARLFDEVLDWLVKNADLLDLARLQRIARQASSEEQRLLTAAARFVAEHGGEGRLSRLLESLDSSYGGPHPGAEGLFFSAGEAGEGWTERDEVFAAAGFLRSRVQLRGMSGRPRSTNPACLRFQTRALVGQGAKAEVLTYLLTHDWTHGRLIAERSAYGQAPVAAYLSSLQEAGLVDRRDEGKKALYRLNSGLRAAFPTVPPFVDWVRLWPALVAILKDLEPAGESEEAAWVRLALSLEKRELGLRAEGFEVEVGELRGWARRGPEALVSVVERVTARLAELAQ